MAYMAAEKERGKGTEMETRMCTRMYDMLTTRVQELSNDLGIPDIPQPYTYAEAATQTEETSQDEDPEDNPHTLDLFAGFPRLLISHGAGIWAVT